MKLRRARRLEKLAERLAQRSLAYALVSSPENVEYLTGFPATGHPPRACYFLASREGRGVLWVSKLDLEEAEERAEGFVEVRALRKGLGEEVEEALKGEGRLGVELGGLSYREVEELQRRLGAARVADSSGLVEELRAVKEVGEVELIKKAVEAAERGIEKGVEALAQGACEREVAGIMEAEARRAGADGVAFDTIVSCSPESSQPHRIAGGNVPKRGEPIVIDFGVRVSGYCSDLSRTVVVGEPRRWVEEALEAVIEAKRAAEEALRPGLGAGKVDLKARSLLKSRRLAKYFIHGLGHGVGLSVHEAPTLTPRSRDRLKAGMVVTIEPGLYFKGRGGLRVEDVYLVAKGRALKLGRLEEWMVL